MSVRALVQLAECDFFSRHTNLRERAKRVTDFGLQLQAVIEDLIATLEHHKLAVGLAAPQIGCDLAIAAVNASPQKVSPTLVLVNPEIQDATGPLERMKESCMSLPHYRGPVRRHRRVTVVYQDPSGSTLTETFEGFTGRVVQHEIDHLNGVLYVDRMVDRKELEPVNFFRES